MARCRGLTTWGRRQGRHLASRQEDLDGQLAGAEDSAPIAAACRMTQTATSSSSSAVSVDAVTRAVLRSTGRYFPSKVVPNSYFYEDLGLDTSEEWIRSRTGIITRHMVDREAGGHTHVHGGGEASPERAGVAATEIDGVICATNTPDLVFPLTGCLIQTASAPRGPSAGMSRPHARAFSTRSPRVSG